MNYNFNIEVKSDEGDILWICEATIKVETDIVNKYEMKISKTGNTKGDAAFAFLNYLLGEIEHHWI